VVWRIRPARLDDAAFVLRITPRLGDAFPLPPWRRPEEVARAEAAALATALESPRAGTALLLVENEAAERGGYVYLETQIDYFRQSPHAHVGILAVSREVEGQGAARVLLDAAEGWARERKLDFITLNVFATNARARAVYEHLGYSPETVRYVKSLD
jgi:ribosomal protein S18 acetylase RimI-like enzyme